VFISYNYNYYYYQDNGLSGIGIELSLIPCVGRSVGAESVQLVRRKYHDFSDKVEMEYRLFCD